MSEEEKKGNSLADPGADEPFDKPESGEPASENGGPGPKPSRWNRGGLLLNKRVVAPVLGLVVLALVGFGSMKVYEWMNPKPEKGASISPAKDDLREDSLPPFFIPLPEGSSNRLVMIDLSVVWDSLASLRFKKGEVKIRDSLYTCLVKVVEAGKDPRKDFSSLESEASRVFREALGTEGLDVKVKTVNAF